LSEETREPGSVAGAAAEETSRAPAVGEPAVAEPVTLVPGARKPETVGGEPAEDAGTDEHAADEHAGVADEHADVTEAEHAGVTEDEHAEPVKADEADEAEREELERLRTEVRELREQSRGDGAGQSWAASWKGRRGRWRALVSAVLITLGCVLAPVSVLGVWAANQVSNTDRYVANMAPLISEPPIQHALSARITGEITSRLDVPALTASASAELARANLPRLSALLTNFQAPIANGVDSLVSTTVSRAVASPAMANIWVSANRAAHQGIVRVLSGQGNGSLSVVNNQVVLNLGPLITQVKENLTARGFGFAARIPTVNATFPLFEAPNLAKAQQGYRLITTLRWVLPFLALILLAVGIWTARRHRRALIGAALGLSASMLVLAAALLIARAIYLNSVPQTVLPADAAAALYDTLVRFIRDGLRLLLVIGLVVAAGAFLAGPSTAAVRTRRAVKSGIDWVRARGERAGLRTGPVGTWVGAHKTLLRAAAVGVAVLIFVFWGQPSLAVVIWLVILLLVVLGLIELLAGPAGGSATAAEAGRLVTAPAAGGSATAPEADHSATALEADPTTAPEDSRPATVKKE
jgi:hypothetical protein